MRKFFSILVCALMAMTNVCEAQSAIELAKAKAEEDAFFKKMLNTKPTKTAKKQAKDYAREGWTEPAGYNSLEQQFTKSQIYGEMQMLDEDGNRTNRYIMANGMNTAGSFNAGNAAARLAAQNEIAALMETEIVSAMQQKIDNSQSSAISAVTVDKFNQRTKAIVDQALTNSTQLVTMYRRLANNQFEVQVRLAFDKKELMARLKRNLQKELEEEGDELNDIVDEILKTKF